MLRRLASIICFLSASVSLASPMCNEYKKNSPRMYDLYCTTGGSGNTKPAGASSTFTESFNLNPATLPTEESPYGVEVISTYLHSGAPPGFPTLGVVKGFHRFGAAISTAGGNTFYSNHLVQRLSGPSDLQTLTEKETQKGKFSDLNLGTSFGLLQIESGLTLQLGLSARYNQMTNTWGGGPALMLVTRFVTLGAGVSREQVSNFIPRTSFYSLMVSKRFGFLELEYDRLSVDDQPLLSPIEIFTMSAGFRNIIFTLAGRRLNYVTEGNVTQLHFAIQCLVTHSFSLGYLYNYIPGGNSLGAQVYF